MAFEWLTGGSLPQFWKNYISFFDDEPSNQSYVVFDLEVSENILKSVVAIAVKENAIEVGQYLELYVAGESAAEKVVEAEAVIRFLNFIQNATLVGHNVNSDIETLNQALKKLDLGRIKNQFMDTNVLYQRWKDLPEDTKTSLDEVCEALKIDKNERNSLSGNAYSTALAFIKLKKKIGI